MAKAKNISFRADLVRWIKNAERYGDDKFGAAASLMRDAVDEIDRLKRELTECRRAYSAHVKK